MVGLGLGSWHAHKTVGYGFNSKPGNGDGANHRKLRNFGILSKTLFTPFSTELQPRDIYMKGRDKMKQGPSSATLNWLSFPIRVQNSPQPTHHGHIGNKQLQNTTTATATLISNPDYSWVPGLFKIGSDSGWGLASDWVEWDIITLGMKWWPKGMEWMGMKGPLNSPHSIY